MLRITDTQIDAFRVAMQSDFEAEMVQHCVDFSPRLSAVLGEERLHLVVRAAAARGARHGLTFKGPLRLYIELGFLFGSGFDDDVQYPWVRECLGAPDPATQMERAEALFTRSVEAIERIHGPNNRDTEAALRKLQALADAPPALRPEDFRAAVLAMMASVHPQKLAYVGEPALGALVDAGVAKAAWHGLTDLDDALLFVVLMFAFGQHCTVDPLYPWIEGTLSNPKVATPALRARQLRKKSLTWLRHVLANRELPA